VDKPEILPDAISRQEASDAGIPSETWETWIERTYIVPK
jgi:hypothetical protein